MIFDHLTEPEKLAIEMAAHGAVSGTLSEWPVLLSALRKMGCYVTRATRADHARELCWAWFPDARKAYEALRDELFNGCPPGD